MTATKTKAHVTIDIRDVRDADGVEQALIQWAETSDATSAGVVGMAFATSGPGPGWSKQYGPDEWSCEAFSGGALYYLDEADGRLRSVAPAEDDDEDALTDIGGCRYTVGDWSDESVVCVECPDIEDAMRHPLIAAAMAEAVIRHHGPCSDRKAWAELVKQIKAAAEAFEDIDADELEGDE